MKILPSVLMFGLLATATLSAQAGPMESPGENVRALREHLFRPEMIMRHQAEIKLRDEQRTQITALLEKAQADTVKLQWEVESARGALVKAVEPAKVNADAAVAAAKRLMDVEHQMKLKQLRLLVDVKNVLDPEQQKVLAELRPDFPLGGGMRDGRRPGMMRPGMDMEP